MKLINKTILITGASTGIGRALALALATENRLILIARREKLLREILDETESGDKNHLIFPCDVSSQESVEAVCAKLKKDNILPDILILNAGIGSNFNVHEFDLQRVRHTFEVNFWGMVRFVHLLLPEMLALKSGIIAATGSIAGYRGMPGSAPYSASKAALSVFIESLRVDLADSGIKFSVISPGFVATPMTAKHGFQMPFLMTPEKAATTIIRGLEKGRPEIHFPLKMSIPAKLAKLIPDLWWAKFMHRWTRR